MRAPRSEIPAPPFPRELPWVNVASLRMDKQRGRPVLIEFWDFCRVNSLRTLPYLQAWHAKYAEAGLRVIGVHTGGWEVSRDEAAIRRAVERLGIGYPVLIDSGLEVWDHYGNQGWPARYLWDADQALFSYHYGEGAYAETEREIQELLGVSGELVAPVRPEDDPQALVAAQSADVAGPFSGPYEAGEVWAVCSGSGALTVNGASVAIDGAAAYPLLRHGAHTEGVLALEVGDGVVCHATCFTPGVVPAGHVLGHPAGA